MIALSDEKDSINEKQVEDLSEIVMVTVRLPKAERDALDAVISQGQSRNDFIRQLFAEKVKASGGSPATEDFEAKLFKLQGLRLTQKKREDDLFKILDTTPSLGYRRDSIFRDLCAFATHFGTDQHLNENLEKALVDLKHYQYKGTEPFTESTLFTFISYIEALINRRKLEATIRTFWRKTLPKKTG